MPLMRRARTEGQPGDAERKHHQDDPYRRGEAVVELPTQCLGTGSRLRDTCCCNRQAGSARRRLRDSSQSTSGIRPGCRSNSREEHANEDLPGLGPERRAASSNVGSTLESAVPTFITIKGKVKIAIPRTAPSRANKADRSAQDQRNRGPESPRRGTDLREENVVIPKAR